MTGMRTVTLTTFEQTEPDGNEGILPRCTSNYRHISLCVWLFVLEGLLSPVGASGASFDCSQAKRALEVLICNDAELSSLDEQEGKAYYALRATVPKGSNEAAGLLSEQREFLKNRTRTCHIAGNPLLSEAGTWNGMITCLKRFYTLRLDELQKRLAASGTPNGPAEQDQNDAEIPSGLLATLRNDFSKRFRRRCW
jgi:uncharacterized protein YecT (DUF1311 family)